MEKISAIIITRDEERNIGRCLDSLHGIADEVVVVDSGSTDGTESICRRFATQFPALNYQFHPWAGYSQQKNYANSLATHPWILSIDADEALSPTLRQEFMQMKEKNLFEEDTVYAFNRLTNYCGHWIHHCGWYPDRCDRLWHQGAAQWDGEIHEELRYSREVRHKLIKGDLWHYSYYTVEEHALRTVKYAVMAGEKAFRMGRRHKGGIGIKASWTFTRNYLLKLGFLDGRMGYQVCRLSALYTLIKYAHLRELTVQKGNHEDTH